MSTVVGVVVGSLLLAGFAAAAVLPALRAALAKPVQRCIRRVRLKRAARSGDTDVVALNAPLYRST